MRRRKTLNLSIVTIALLLLLPVSAFAADRPELEFDGRDWVLGYQASCGGFQIEEFVLDGESACNWCELVTWQYFADWQGRASASEIMRQLRHRRMFRTPDVDWEILSQGFDSVLYTWEIENARTGWDHCELVLIIKGHQGLHVFRYAAKDREIFSENLDSWIASFEEIEVSE